MMLLVVFDLVLSPPRGTCFEHSEHNIMANLVSSTSEKYSQILYLFQIDIDTIL